YCCVVLGCHPTPVTTPFPYTTLFRSRDLGRRHPVQRGAGLVAARSHSRDRGGHCWVFYGALRCFVTLASNIYFPPPFHPSPGSRDRKSTRLNSSHVKISYAVFCLKKK